MPIQFEFLPVDGDAILVTTEDFVMLIDGGGKSTYRRLKERLELLKRPIDLVVLTHIDEDHIFGLIKLFQDIRDKTTNIKVKKIWFNCLLDRKFLIESGNNDNSPAISQKQAEDFSSLLKESALLEIEYLNDVYCEKHPYNETLSLSSSLKIRLLSPMHDPFENFNNNCDAELFDKQDMLITHGNDYHLSIEKLMKIPFKNDSSKTNASSIAFIMFYGDYQFLMLADANIEIITKQLLSIFQSNPTINNSFEFVKISHHGSAKNTSDEFLDIIDCQHFIFCARGDSLPSKQTIVRIIKNAIKNNSINNMYINKSLTDNQQDLVSEGYGSNFNFSEKNYFEYGL